MKLLIILLIILIGCTSCVTYNPNYMESKTTGERIIDVAILLGFGAGIGITIYEEIR